VNPAHPLASTSQLPTQARKLTQEVLDHYDMGVRVVSIKLQDVNPPEPVKPSFNEVNEAKQEQEQAINNAEKHYNEVIPEARGVAEKRIASAQGFATEVLNRAKGDAERFESLLKEFKRAPQVTRERMLGKTEKFFRWGLGGKLGSGRQWMSWIHRDDLIRIFLAALENPGLSGVVNGVGPQPVTNREFTKIYVQVLRRPTLASVPTLPLKIVLGEMSGLLLGGQRVLPAKLEKSGFQFHYIGLKSALSQIFSQPNVSN